MFFHPLNSSSLPPLHFSHINPIVATLDPGISFVVVDGVKFIENLVNIEGDRLHVEIFNPDSNSCSGYGQVMNNVVTKEKPKPRMAMRGLMRGKWRGGKEEGVEGNGEWRRWGVVIEKRTWEEMDSTETKKGDEGGEGCDRCQPII